MIWIDAVSISHRQDERHHDHDGGEDVHQHADHKQKDVQRQQEQQLAADDRFHPLQKLHGNLRLNHPTGEADGSRHDDQNGAHQGHGLDDDAGQVAPNVDIPVQHDFDEQHVNRRERAGFVNPQQARSEPAYQNDRDRDLPLGNPQRLQGRTHRETRTLDAVAHPYVATIDHQGEHHDDPGQDAGHQDLVDHEPGDDAVQDERHTRWKQQPERASRSHQPHREVLGVLLAHQRGKQQRPDGDDRDAAAARERGEESRRHQADRRQATRHPAEPGARKLNEPLRCSRFGQQVASKREQRNRHQVRVFRELGTEDVDRHRCPGPLGHAHEQRHRGRPEQAEQRGPDECQQDKSETDDHAAPPLPFMLPTASLVAFSAARSAASARATAAGPPARIMPAPMP